MIQRGRRELLLVDDRAGSQALAPLLANMGLPVQLTRLDFGDCAWLGIGDEQAPVSVGVEVKTIHDVVKCIADGRFAGHQLPGLVANYDQVWLLIQGLIRCNAKSGMLEYRHSRGEWREVTAGSRRFMYRDLLTWLFSAGIKGGIQTARVGDWNEATVWISSLYQWWQKGWESHKSHLAFHDGTRHGTPYKRDKATMMVRSLADKALLSRPTLARMVAAQLPNVGWTKSAAIAKRYRTVTELAEATPEELQDLDGIGPVIAQKIYDSLRSVK